MCKNPEGEGEIIKCVETRIQEEEGHEADV